MNKILKQILILASLIALLVLPYFAFAGSMIDNLTSVGTGGGYEPSSNKDTLLSFIGTGIKAALSLLGVIFIILIIYGGYNWMIAGGDEQKITTAKDTIRRAIIGLMIVVGASAITSFIFNYV